MTSQEVAAALNVSLRRVQKLARDGRLGTKEGRDYRFTPEEVAAFRPGVTGRPKKEKKPNAST